MTAPKGIVTLTAGLAAATAGTVIGVRQLLVSPPPTVNVPRDVAALTKTQQTIVTLARQHGVGSGILYVWGGTGHGGFDCSGFVWHVLYAAGISVPRTSYAQWVDRRSLLTTRDIRAGDVAFFRGAYGSYSSPGHVGIYLGGGRVVEYYTSGRPAREGALTAHRDFIGARRWWSVPQVRKREVGVAVWAARHWKMKISGHSYDTVIYVPGTTATFPKWKARAIIRWANRTGYKVAGGLRTLRLTLWPKPKPKKG